MKIGKPGHWKNEYLQRNSGNYHNKGNNNYHNKGNNNNYKNKGKFNNLEDTTSSSFSSSSSSFAPPNYNNNLELTNAEGMQEQLFRINKINGYSAWILLDSGASCNFLDKNL